MAIGLENEEFERAFAEFQQFGPRRRHPIEQRLREILPELPQDRVAKLLALCNEIESFAIGVAGQVVYGDLTENAASKQISDRFPFLTTAQLRRTLSQALYFAAM